jgi:hypothetical protein
MVSARHTDRHGLNGASIMETMTYPRGQLRVSDADRDRAIAELSEHFQAGRLTQEEFEERTGQALQARTGKDLAALFTDLPRPRVPGVSPAGGSARPGPQRPAEPYRAPIPRVAVVACAVVVAVSVLGGVGPGHHALFGLAPVLIVLLVVRCLFLRRRPDRQRFR